MTSAVNEFRKVPNGEDIELAEFLETYYNRMADDLNFLIRKLSMQNFDGQVFHDITIPASSELIVGHKLGLKPAYRMLLRRDGIDVIDKFDKWNESSVTLENTSIVDVTQSFILLLE